MLSIHRFFLFFIINPFPNVFIFKNLLLLRSLEHEIKGINQTFTMAIFVEEITARIYQHEYTIISKI